MMPARHKKKYSDDNSDDMPSMQSSDDSTDGDGSDGSDDENMPVLLSDDNDDNDSVTPKPKGGSEEDESDEESGEESDEEDEDKKTGSGAASRRRKDVAPSRGLGPKKIGGTDGGNENKSGLHDDLPDHEPSSESEVGESEDSDGDSSSEGEDEKRGPFGVRRNYWPKISAEENARFERKEAEKAERRKHRLKISAEEKTRLEREEEEKAERHKIEDENNKKAREETRRVRKEERAAVKAREKERLERERGKRVDETVEALSRGSLCAMRGEWRDAFTAYCPIIQPLLEPDAASPPEKLAARHDLNVLKYVFGLACFHTDRIDSAVAAFEHILAHDPGRFPLAHLALGDAHLRRRQYREACATLEVGNHLLAICEPVLIKWPELDENVPESEPEALKREMGARLTEARNPPPPDAMCRIDICSASCREIRWDPTKTEVYHRIECDSRGRCVLEYHKGCYRKLMKGMGLSDSLLGRECPTPDCDGLIVAYHRLYGDGEIKDSKRLSNIKAQHIRDAAAAAAKFAQPEVAIAENTKKSEKKEKTDKTTKKAKKPKADTPPKVTKEDAAKAAAPEAESEPATTAVTTDAAPVKDTSNKDADGSAMITQDKMREWWEAFMRLQPDDGSTPMLDGQREGMFDEWLNIQLNLPENWKWQGARKPRPESERAPPPSIEAEDISKGVVTEINRKQQKIKEIEDLRRLAEARKKEKEKAKAKEKEKGEEGSTSVGVGGAGGGKKKKKNKFVPLEGWYSQEALTESGGTAAVDQSNEKPEDEIDRVIQRVTGQPSGKGKARYEPTAEEILEEEQIRRVMQESLDYQPDYSRYLEGMFPKRGEASWTVDDSMEGYDLFNAGMQDAEFGEFDEKGKGKAVLIPFSEDPRWRSTNFAPSSRSNGYNGAASGEGIFHAAGNMSSALAFDPPTTKFGWEDTSWDTQAIAQLGWETDADLGRTDANLGSPNAGNGFSMMITEEWHPREEVDVLQAQVARPASNGADVHIVTWESTSIVDDFLRGFVDEDDDGVASSQPLLDPDETAEQEVSRPEHITMVTPVESSISLQTDDTFSSKLSNLISQKMSQPLQAIVHLPPLQSLPTANPLGYSVPPTVNKRLSDPLGYNTPPTINIKLSDLILNARSNNMPSLPVSSNSATFGTLPDWLNDVTETGVNGQTVVISKEKAKLMQIPSPPSSSSPTQPSASSSAVRSSGRSSLSSDSSQTIEVADFLTRLHKRSITTPTGVSPTPPDWPDWPNMKETYGSQLPVVHDHHHLVDPSTYYPKYVYGYEHDPIDFLASMAPQFPPLQPLTPYFVPPLEPGHSSPTSPTYPPSGPASPVWLQSRPAHYSPYGPLDYVEFVQPVMDVSGVGRSLEKPTTPLFQMTAGEEDG